MAAFQAVAGHILPGAFPPYFKGGDIVASSAGDLPRGQGLMIAFDDEPQTSDQSDPISGASSSSSPPSSAAPSPSFVPFYPSPEELASLSVSSVVSPFGNFQTNTTVVDESVRKARERRISSCEWPEGMEQQVKQQIGQQWDTPIKLVPYKLNIYSDDGGKFKPHVDTYRGAGHLGSLVIQLACPHIGGELLIQDNMGSTWSSPTHEHALLGESFDLKQGKLVAFDKDARVSKVVCGGRCAWWVAFFADQVRSHTQTLQRGFGFHVKMLCRRPVKACLSPLSFQHNLSSRHSFFSYLLLLPL